MVNLVRGQRDDIYDDLYRVAPQNLFVGLNYTQAGWGLTLESFAYAAERNVFETNQEQETSGYGLFNLKGFWAVREHLRIGFGVHSFADRVYRDHLGGVNRVSGNPDIQAGERLPGIGRNFFAPLDFRW